VLFADLQGFTSFSERSDPMYVSTMLNEYFEVAVPMIANQYGGEVDKLGLVGAEGRRGYTVIGDAVNLASRLEGQAKVGQVVIGAETYRALPDDTKVEPLRGVQVKGKEAQIEAYVIVELPLDASSERGDRLRRKNHQAKG
jgi:class 3 adenylate cyclase